MRLLAKALAGAMWGIWWMVAAMLIGSALGYPASAPEGVMDLADFAVLGLLAACGFLTADGR